MDDMISRQAAIEAARDWYEGLICGSFKGLEKRLRALPAAQPDLSGYSDKLWKAAYERGKAEAEQRWIPVTERLPKVGKFVLVTDIYLDEATIARLIDDGGWEDQHGNWSSFGCVSAWMPLPQPYERSEDD